MVKFGIWQANNWYFIHPAFISGVYFAVRNNTGNIIITFRGYL